MMMAINIDGNRLIFEKESYALENRLVKKLNRVCKGITQKHPKEDALILNEGKEGKGKTNTSIVEATYVKIISKREVHLFFRLDDIIKYAQANKEKIIIWDEPSLDSLKIDHLKKINHDLLRLFMTIRKKRHFFIINYTKFWKFPEYLVVDRADGMIHMHEHNIGRFFYIRKKNLENLWNDKVKKNKRAYKKYRSFGGRMPDIMEKHFSELGFFVNEIPNATYDDYENEKDKAILSIGGEPEKTSKKEEIINYKLQLLRLRVSTLWKKLPISQIELGQHLGIDTTRLREWAKIDLENNPGLSSSA